MIQSTVKGILNYVCISKKKNNGSDLTMDREVVNRIKENSMSKQMDIEKARLECINKTYNKGISIICLGKYR